MSNSFTDDGAPPSVGVSIDSRENILSEAAGLTARIEPFFGGRYLQLEPPPLVEPLESTLSALARLTGRDAELLDHAIEDLRFLSETETENSTQIAQSDLELPSRAEALKEMLKVIESNTELRGDQEGALDVSAVIRAIYALQQTLSDDSEGPGSDYEFLVSDFARALIKYLVSSASERRIRHLKNLVEAIRENEPDKIREKGSEYIFAVVKSAELMRLANALRMVALPTNLPALPQLQPDSPQ